MDYYKKMFEGLSDIHTENKKQILYMLQELIYSEHISEVIRHTYSGGREEVDVISNDGEVLAQLKFY